MVKFRKPPFALTEKDMRAWIERYLDSVGSLREIATNLDRIATVLERMDGRTVDAEKAWVAPPARRHHKRGR